MIGKKGKRIKVVEARQKFLNSGKREKQIEIFPVAERGKPYWSSEQTSSPDEFNEL